MFFAIVLTSLREERDVSICFSCIFMYILHGFLFFFFFFFLFIYFFFFSLPLRLGVFDTDCDCDIPWTIHLLFKDFFLL